MFKMCITKKQYVFIFITIILALVAIFSSATVVYAHDEEINSTGDFCEETVRNANYDADTYGIYTSLSISLSGGDGILRTTVRNDLTIFPSTVYVVLQLYSSTSYCESYHEMVLEGEAVIADLDMGNSISVEASTGGIRKYWLGRAYYQVDHGSWKEKITGAVRFNADGTLYET